MAPSEGPSTDPAREGHPVGVRVALATTERNRWTAAFRLILAIPHLIVVGGPMALGLSSGAAGNEEPGTAGSGAGGGGLLGIVALVVSVAAWIVLVVTARHPSSLWRFSAFYLRWRVRAIAYLMLLRDEYPPFGDAPYPAELDVDPPDPPRNRLTVFFRLILALPHLLVLWFLGIAWIVTAVAAWIAILATGRFPEALYDFGTGMLRWTSRVEAYLLLLRDEYPPFRLGA